MNHDHARDASPARTQHLALLQDELGVTLFAHTVVADGAPVSCVTWRTRGFAAIDHPELTITYARPADEGLDVVQLDAIRFITGLYSRAKGGAPPIGAGMTAEYPPGLFDEREALGAVFVRAFEIEGVPVRRAGLSVVVLHRDELEVARSLGARRVLARLARHGRHAPFPFWWTLDRPSVARADEASSALETTARMAVLGASATLRGDVVRVCLPPQRARVIGDALRVHGDDAFAWMTDATGDADAFLVWEPGQSSPSAAPVRGSRGRAVAGTFVMFTPGAERDRGALFEDGFRFELEEASWAGLREAVTSGAAFELPPGERSKGLSLVWEEPFADAPPSASYQGVEVYAGLEPPRVGVAPKVLAEYVKRVCAAIDRHFEDAWYAPGQDLIVHVEVHPGRPPRADLALRPGPPHPSVNGLCGKVESIPTPEVTAPVVFRTMWSLWGGAEAPLTADEG